MTPGIFDSSPNRSLNSSINSRVSNASSSYNRKGTFCPFCKKNGEVPEYYANHKLRDENNNVTCPVLSQYTCPNCQVRGDHTVRYCPKTQPTKDHRSDSCIKPSQGLSAKQQQPLRPQPMLRTPLKTSCFTRQQPVQPQGSKLATACKASHSLGSGPVEYQWPILYQILMETSVLVPSLRHQFLLNSNYPEGRFKLIREVAIDAESAIIMAPQTKQESGIYCSALTQISSFN